jgi:hypothetical protein
MPSAQKARDLYTSPLYRGRRAFVEKTCDRWFILSALHGLVDPDDVVAPYDQTLADAKEEERRAWSIDVVNDLERKLGDLSGLEFQVHAGAHYLGHGLEAELLKRDAVVHNPVEGLSLGRQLAFYKGSTNVLL